MKYLCNGFSIAMLRDPNCKINVTPLSEEEFINCVYHGDFTSVIGHESLAGYLTKITAKKIPYNRKNIQLNYEDEILICYMTGRLPEHPTAVEYRGRMNFAHLSFEKKTNFFKNETIENDITEVI